MSEGVPDVFDDHFAEEPMRGTTGDALHDAGTVIDGINGSDTPTVIVAVLAVVHADFPPITGTGTPPFA